MGAGMAALSAREGSARDGSGAARRYTSRLSAPHRPRPRGAAKARRSRASFENASRVVRYDDAGNRIVLEGEAYEAAHRRVVEGVERWCDRS